jgi:acyl-coenzyme A synthetase/AMP-(fatty) acid ligase
LLIINIFSYRIGPSEVEAVLQTHPAVAENAAVASPDPLRGEVVKAFIVLTDQYKNLEDEAITLLKQEIQDFVKGQTAPYKYPRKVLTYFILFHE